MLIGEKMDGRPSGAPHLVVRDFIPLFLLGLFNIGLIKGCDKSKE